MWWTVIPSRDSQSSQIPAVSRVISWRFFLAGHAPSIRRACLFRRSGMPPNLAVNTAHEGARRVDSKQRRFP